MSKNLLSKDIDNISLSILHELCYNARTSAAEIGRRVGLTAPAVGERIKKLEDLGYVKGYTALLDLDKLGLKIQAFVSFKCHHKAKDINKIIGGFPEITEWHTITGNSSMLLKITTNTREQLAKIIMQLEEYGDTNTSLILQSNTEINLL
ncbi:MAG: Lrp/AsnC family transcriptional regulator, partial [Bacteroidetes bacterium]|nr:Lrp/AsnC family transcriptional regulator [Bacteroidota bacterium]